MESIFVVFKHVSVEPILFLMTTGTFMTSITRQSLLIDAVCSTHFNLSEVTCKNLSSNETVKHMVEKEAATYVQAYCMMEAVVPAFLCFIVGPWADKNGRKWPLVLGLFGNSLAFTGYSALSVIEDYPLGCFLLPSVAYAICGQYPVNTLCAFSYLSDVTTMETKTTRYTYT